MFQTFISRHNSNFFSDKLVLTSVTPASSAPVDRKSGSAGMPRPSSYAVFCLKKKKEPLSERTKIRNHREHEVERSLQVTCLTCEEVIDVDLVVGRSL